MKEGYGGRELEIHFNNFRKLFKKAMHFFNKVEDASSKNEVLIEGVRKSLSYSRLHSRMLKKDSESVINKGELSFGELVDAVFIYCSLSGGGFFHVEQVLNSIVISFVDLDNVEEYHVFIDNVFSRDASENLQNININVYEHVLNTNDIIQNSLGVISHYPGGIKLKESAEHDQGYAFLLTNRQQADNGKIYIKDFFRELGLPVKSEIFE